MYSIDNMQQKWYKSNKKLSLYSFLLVVANENLTDSFWWTDKTDIINQIKVNVIFSMIKRKEIRFVEIGTTILNLLTQVEVKNMRV